MCVSIPPRDTPAREAPVLESQYHVCHVVAKAGVWKNPNSIATSMSRSNSLRRTRLLQNKGRVTVGTLGSSLHSAIPLDKKTITYVV